VDVTDQVHTFTFTPKDNCYTEFSFTVTIKESVATEFDYENDEVCDASEVPTVESLDTKDKNGVEGIWSVDVTDQVNTYTFTPTDNCYTEFSFTVTVTESVATEFEYEDYEVCDASEVPALESLDTKDKNGVEGTWAVDVTDQVYTFTFKPIDNCFTEFSFTVTVTGEVQATFDQTIYNYCSEEAFKLPTPNNGVTGKWDRLFNGAGKYVFTPDSTCGITTSISVVEDDSITPIFDILDTYCYSNTIISLPSISNNGIVGLWSNGLLDTKILGTRELIFTPSPNQCAESIKMSFTVENCDKTSELTIPTFISPNGDGYNDVWRVEGIEYYPNAELYIYNRYNKLIFEGKGSENCVWDGTYLGRPLPSTDYWYVLKLNDKLVKTGHITVKNR
ncbi:MAG: T9SS type B sorting domain-containing protein, partial [Weeksellaceae bacterium]